MATDSPSTRPAVADDGAATPVIENEIPTYRAISALAVGSVFFGLLAALSYAHPAFLVAAGAAIVLGLLAVKRIRRQPDAYTGAGLAQAGIALGLIFGLSSVTLNFVNGWLMRRRAEEFVRSQLMAILNERDLNSALWYRMPPGSRRGLSPEEVVNRMRNPNDRSPMSLEMTAGPVVRLVRELRKSPKARIELHKIEATDTSGATPGALAVLRIHWPAEEDHEAEAETEEGHHHHHDLPDVHGEFALAYLKCRQEGRSLVWWVEDYAYPYTPNTYVEKVKPVDDGHGHAH